MVSATGDAGTDARELTQTARTHAGVTVSCHLHIPFSELALYARTLGGSGGCL